LETKWNKSLLEPLSYGLLTDCKAPPRSQRERKEV